MEGVVKLVNEDIKLFVAETDNGFTVFEFEEMAHIENGDVVSGLIDSVACATLFNYSRNSRLKVFVREIVRTLEDAEALIHIDRSAGP